jgi:hypothetical protein
MTFLLYAIGLLFVGMVAVFVALPLLTASTSLRQASLPEDHADQEDHAARWEKQKTDAYAAIKEAEFDKQMGKLTEEDYQLTRRKYETRAVEALTQLDRLEQSGQELSKKGKRESA